MKQRIIRKEIFILLLCTFLILISSHKGQAERVKLKKVKFIEKLIIGEEERGQILYDPIDIEVFESNIYILDIRACIVMKLNENGKLLLSFGRKGQGPQELNAPRSFFICNKKIYVANTNNERIDIFDLNGFHINNINVMGQPREICVDSEGSLFIHFSYNNYLIHKYREDGKLLKSFVIASNAKDPMLQTFYNYLEIAITDKNELIVAYKFQNKIEKYDKEGNLIFSKERPLLGTYKPLEPTITESGRTLTAFALTVNVAYKAPTIYVLTNISDKLNSKVICDRINNNGIYLDSFIIPIHTNFIGFHNNYFLLINSDEATLHKFEIVEK